jgi:cobalamin biosynthesis Mg chelatase CobN
MRLVGYSSWAPDERANAIRLAFPRLREQTGEAWSLDHFGAADFNDPAGIARLRGAIREADVLIGWQSMSIETVERLATLLREMDAAGELGNLLFLWYDIPHPWLQSLMFRSMGYAYDHTKESPMRALTMKLKRFVARARHEETDAFWEAREGFLGMQKMVDSAPLMVKFINNPVMKTLVMCGYWNNRSVENVGNMFLYLKKHFTTASYAGEVPLPKKVENEGIYHPAHAGMFAKPDAYLRWYEPWFTKTYGRAPWERIGFITHDLFLPEWNTPVLDAAIRAWEERGVGVICSMTAVFNAHVVSRGHLLAPKTRAPLVSAVYHNVPLYLAGSMFAGSPDASVAFIHDLGDPRVYTSPVNAAMSRADIARSTTGIASLEYIGNVVTPETEGITPLPPICSREPGAEISALEPIADRIDVVADVTTRWLRLRTLANAEKKLAVFVYNFPPGPANVGVAYFLDVAASLREMLAALSAEGYTVGPLDPDDATTSRKLREMHAGEHHVGTVSAGEIRDWVAELPLQAQALFATTWGAPPAILPVKGLRYGNVLVLLQDMRGMEDLTVIHDKKAPPSPWLLASYRYATRRFDADAILHVGTHGLVEWSKGKEWSPALGDYPEFLIDRTPHVYLFNSLDPVEASIARRRAYATIVSHLCPPLRAVEGSETLRGLHALVHDYYNCPADDLERRDGYAADIAELVAHSGLRIAAPADGDQAAFVGAVHDELIALDGEFAPAGQHVFGRGLSDDDRLHTFLACLEFADVDVHRLVATCYGLDYDALARAPFAPAGDGAYSHDLIDEIRDASRALIESEVLRPGATGARSAVTGILRARTIAGAALLRDPYEHEDFEMFLARARTLWRELGRVGEAERSGLLTALAGRYLAPSPGGEIVGDWTVLPTGRNMASTDVRMLPREAAQRKGKATVAQLLERACTERGHYPEAVGVVLWGSEMLESEGVGIAQALDLVGARVAKDKFGRAERAVLIPLAELGRPRIDILANTSTVFKNTFPGAVRLVHDAVALAANADEPHEQNFVRKHVDELVALGVEPRLARARCFGMGDDAFMGQVGAMLDRGTFGDFNDIGNAWISDNSFAMLPTAHHIALEPAPQVQRHLLERVEVIQQPLVAMGAGGPVKEDMFASFTSAFGAAKRAIGQEGTMIVVTDLTRREPRVRDFRTVVVNGVLTRFHSREWRDRMLRHGYSGVNEFGDVFKSMRSTQAALGDTISPELWKRTVEVTLDEWDRIAEANPHKTRELGEVLLDTQRRGMWEDADLERQLAERLNELDADQEMSAYARRLTPAPSI